MDIKTDKLISTLAPGASRPSSGPASNPVSQEVTPAPTEPAAKVRFSETVRGQQLASAVNEVRGEVFDMELVRQIQERLDQGTLEINYDAVARELLQDAMAVAGKPKSGVTV
jgi:anti-sigma28 factor (negative regulator of flagellin synthesis)